MGIRKSRESELNRELAHHLHHLTAEYERQGHSRDEAMRMAAREFGGAEQVREQCRDESRWRWINGFRQDLTFGFRMMRRTPLITAAAITTLALGIGASTAIFSLMDVVLWRALPVPHPEQLSLVNWISHRSSLPHELADSFSGSWGDQDGVVVADFFSYAAYKQIRASIVGAAEVASFVYYDPASVSYQGRATIARERPVSGNFLEVLGVKPERGRLLRDGDDATGAPPVAVISHRFWRDALGSDANVVGRAITIDNRLFSIAGVTDGSFYGIFPGDPTEMYVPLHHATTLGATPAKLNERLSNNRDWGISVLVRQFVPDPAAGAKLDAGFRRTWTRTPKDSATAPRLRLDEGARGLGFLRQDFRTSLFILGGLVSLLLLIACTNIANLLLARAVARRKELAMRLALGCGRARLVRQFLTESVLLAAIGATAGVSVAYGTARLLSQFISGRDSRPADVTLDARMLLALLAVAFAALLVFGILPAWQGASKLEFAWLKQGHGSMADGVRRGWTAGRLFVVLQMALSVVLVMSSVVFTRNLLALRSTDTGFDRRNLILFGTRPGSSGYSKERLPAFYARLRRQLEATPGVAGVGLASQRPMNVGGWWETIRLEGRQDRIEVNVNGITPTYLPIYSPRMVAGRNFTEIEIDTNAKVSVISEDLAAKLGGDGVVGRAIAMVDDGPPGTPPSKYTVIGIAPKLAATEVKRRPQVLWLPFSNESLEATVVIRTAINPDAALPAIRRSMEAFDRNLPMVETLTMEEQISRGLQRERMFSTLCNCFGALALVLSIVGLYGVIAYSTSRRRSEIGLRLALGAKRRDVVGMVLREGFITTLTGVLAGLLFLFWGAAYLKKALPDQKPLEAGSFAVTLAILVIAAATATAVPAVRASGVDPAETLRAE